MLLRCVSGRYLILGVLLDFHASLWKWSTNGLTDQRLVIYHPTKNPVLNDYDVSKIIRNF